MPLDTLQAALELANMGARMVPILAHEKRPPFKTGRGHADAASGDPVRLHEWFNDASSWQLGVVLHLSGWVAVDVDPRPDNQAMAHASIIEAYGGLWLNDTAWETTPSGGVHYLYRCPPGVDSTKLKKTLAPGVELQHNLLVVAPSRGRRWGKHPREGLLELPAPILRLATRRPPRPRPETPTGTPANIYGLLEWVRQAPHGDRNNRVFKAACACGRHIRFGELTIGESAVLVNIGADLGMTPEEAELAWRNGLAAEDVETQDGAKDCKNPYTASTDPLCKKSSTTPHLIRVSRDKPWMSDRVGACAGATPASIEQTWDGIDLEDGWDTPNQGDLVVTKDGTTQVGGLQPFQ